MRAPEAPIGCPSAMAPPLTLTLLVSQPRSWLTEIAWAAKASFASIHVILIERVPKAIDNHRISHSPVAYLRPDQRFRQHVRRQTYALLTASND